MILNVVIEEILEEFLSDYDKRIYGRSISKKLKRNQKTISNTLKRLEKENILKFSQEGKNKYYFLNKFNQNLIEIIKLIEITRKLRFLSRYKKFRELFNKLEQKTQGILIIFGSYAKGTANDRSDMDLFVVGKIKEVEDLENTYNIKINLIKSDKYKFDKKEHIIEEIIKNHVILKGVEEFIDLIW